jgi:hypothetical protein
MILKHWYDHLKDFYDGAGKINAFRSSSSSSKQWKAPQDLDQIMDSGRKFEKVVNKNVAYVASVHDNQETFTAVSPFKHPALFSLIDIEADQCFSLLAFFFMISGNRC